MTCSRTSVTHWLGNLHLSVYLAKGEVEEQCRFNIFVTVNICVCYCVALSYMTSAPDGFCAAKTLNVLAQNLRSSQV